MPEHSSLTQIRQRLSLKVDEASFTFALKIAQEKKLLRSKTVAVEAATLEANVAMRAIIRKDTGEDGKEYVKGLMAEEGVENPTRMASILFQQGGITWLWQSPFLSTLSPLLSPFSLPGHPGAAP